jgi:NTP pyrophosphatase (non-canonical NTP hydrolase)
MDKDLIGRIIKFRDDRDWKQFHNPKDLALALSVEAGELLESFLWKKSEEVDLVKVREELSDVVIYAVLMSDVCGLNLSEIVSLKLEKNATKYPVEKSKGSSKKYTEL